MVSSTVARWIKVVMRAAGIDVSVFKPHSTRSASTSRAWGRGVSIPDILKTGDWSSATTFHRYYNRPVIHASFAQAILEGALEIYISGTLSTEGIMQDNCKLYKGNLTCRIIGIIRNSSRGRQGDIPPWNFTFV